MLHLNGKATREVEWAIEELAAGKVGQALRRLCYLRGCPVPVMKKARVRTAAVNVAAPLPRTVMACGPGGTLRETPVRTALPKPRKRIVDRKAMDQYVKDHPECEVLGCPLPPCPEPHHLISRKMHGDDTPGNFARLCKLHHDGWHQHGGRHWLARWGKFLTADTLAKVQRAVLGLLLVLMFAGCWGPQTKAECAAACYQRGLQMRFMSCYPEGLMTHCMCSCDVP